MKLNVLIFSNEDEIHFENGPNIHYIWNLINSSEIQTFSNLSRLIRKYKPVVLCYTGKITCWPTISKLPLEYQNKLVQFNSLKDVCSSIIEDKYITSIIEKPTNPLFSVITTTFHSGKKIFRPYESLRKQSYSNWEWILWDDSKEEHMETWQQLLKFQDEDIRIQCFRANQHSSYIGEMKLLSASLARGDWIVELDHDDIIDDNLFQWCVEAIQKFPDSDFICSNNIELYEKNEEPFSYSDFISYGYNSYHTEWISGKWHNVYHVPHINPKTLSHIVGIPNHVRIWKRSFYEKIGKHNPQLPVADDYELLIRTFLEGKTTVIDAPAYLQYRNDGGNNFTFLRNSLIQYLTHKISNIYSNKIENHFKSSKSDKKYNEIYRVWEKNHNFTYNKGFNTYTPNSTNNTISIVLTVENESTSQLITSLDSIIHQTHTDWLLYIIGNNSPTLNKTMTTIANKYRINIIKKIRWWNLSQKNNRQVSLNYAHRMLINTEFISYLEVGKKWNTHFLKNILNKLKENNKDFISNDLILYNSIHKYKLLTMFDHVSDESLQSLI